MENPDCFECKHKESIPGDAHIKCNHPAVQKMLDKAGKKETALLEMLSIFGSVGRVPPMQLYPEELNIKADETGIKRGWFNYPWNFCPTWLKNCDGFEQK